MKYVIIIVLIVVAAGFVFRNHIGNYLVAGKTEAVTAAGKKDKKEAQDKLQKSDGVTIVQKWELPEKLREISGIAYLDEDRFACIQDEEGIIFIYNRKENKIEKEIPFAGPGDYEGIAVNNSTAYVVRSDGRLYQVPMDGGKSSVKEISTPLTEKHNVEGLEYDKDNNRLLLAIKDEEPGGKDYKGVYAYDLSVERFVAEPVYKIDVNHELLTQEGGKKNKVVRPSEISIHPVTKEIYITDGPASRLLVMNSRGNIKKVYQLGKDYPQAEGIAFSPQGTLFISNEGKERGNIIQTELN